MLGLPKTTEIRKQISKKAVYSKFQMNTAAKEKFDADISRVLLVNEVNPDSVNIPTGENVRGFFVMLVVLKRRDLDEKIIASLSKMIKQNILFVIEYEGESKLAIYHTKLMQTDWKSSDEQRIELQGLNLDKVWENIVIAVGGVNIEEGNTLEQQIATDEKRRKLEREIDKLEKQARAELQPRKKFELVREKRRIERELGSI
ncbi:MAG: DUF4391 domain-containing protein [Anaerovoracaceae bacterium]